MQTNTAQANGAARVRDRFVYRRFGGEESGFASSGKHGRDVHTPRIHGGTGRPPMFPKLRIAPENPGAQKDDGIESVDLPDLRPPVARHSVIPAATRNERRQFGISPILQSGAARGWLCCLAAGTQRRCSVRGVTCWSPIPVVVTRPATAIARDSQGRWPRDELALGARSFGRARRHGTWAAPFALYASGRAGLQHGGNSLRRIRARQRIGARLRERLAPLQRSGDPKARHRHAHRMHPPGHDRACWEGMAGGWGRA